MKVLVADDSQLMRKVLSGYLAEMGISEVHTARDGADALAKAKTSHYDLILLDWNMPRMLGVDVLRRLRGSHFDIPIVMVTSEANRPYVLEAMQAGATDYILKPLPKDTFVSRIRQVLAKAGLSAR